jgi:hypothetical protein
MAILDRSPNPADISVCISGIHLFFYQPPSIFITIYHHPVPCLSTFQTFLLKTSLPVLLPWRLPEGLVRRESIRRQRNGKNDRRRSGLVKRQQCGEKRKSGRRRQHGMQRQSRGLLGSREGGTGGGGGGRTAAIARSGALGPQTHHPSTCQYRADDIGFVYSVQGEEEGDGGGAVRISVRLIVLFFIHC